MQRRPLLVTWLAGGVLTFAAFSLAGVEAGLRLPDLALAVPAGYLPVRNGLWALCCLMTGVGLLRRSRWAPRATRISLSLVGLWFLLDRALLSRSTGANRTLPISIALIAIGLVVTLWVLKRPEVQSYFRENQV